MSINYLLNNHKTLKKGARMSTLLQWLDHVPLTIAIALALTLGLAPFMPEPHIVEKLRMLFSGNLTRPVDIFDFFLHGTPWLILILKLIRLSTAK